VSGLVDNPDTDWDPPPLLSVERILMRFRFDHGASHEGVGDRRLCACRLIHESVNVLELDHAAAPAVYWSRVRGIRDGVSATGARTRWVTERDG
jgi:hypothetical protein